jgi:hypothetical protein
MHKSQAIQPIFSESVENAHTRGYRILYRRELSSSLILPEEQNRILSNARKRAETESAGVLRKRSYVWNPDLEKTRVKTKSSPGRDLERLWVTLIALC